MSKVLYVLQRFDARAGGFVLSLLLFVAGVGMIIKGFYDKGTINIKSVWIEGQLETGSTGLIVLFLSFILYIFIIWSRTRSEYPSIHLKKGDTSFDLECDPTQFDSNTVVNVVREVFSGFETLNQKVTPNISNAVNAKNNVAD